MVSLNSLVILKSSWQIWTSKHLQEQLAQSRRWLISILFHKLISNHNKTWHTSSNFNKTAHISTSCLDRSCRATSTTEAGPRHPVPWVSNLSIHRDRTYRPTCERVTLSYHHLLSLQLQCKLCILSHNQHLSTLDQLVFQPFQLWLNLKQQLQPVE